MTPRDAAETILAAKKAAKRMGRVFKPDFDRLRSAGFSNDDISRIMFVVISIEKNTDGMLASLAAHGQSSPTEPAAGSS